TVSCSICGSDCTWEELLAIGRFREWNIFSRSERFSADRPLHFHFYLNALAVVLESLPEQGPRLPQAVAQKNVSVANDAVFDPETIADMTSNLTRLERALYEFARHTSNDHRLWGRIAIPAKPMRVHH